MVDDAVRRDRVLAQSWLIVRHRWLELALQPRPDLWLLVLTLRMLRARGVPAGHAAGAPVETSPQSMGHPLVVAGLRALAPAPRLAVVLHHLLGLSLDEVADVVDLPGTAVREQLREGLHGVENHLHERRTG